MAKKVLKRFFQIFFATIVSPFTIVTKVEALFGGDFLFNLVSTAMSVMPGKIGSYCRVGFYHFILKDISWDVNIGFGTFFTKKDVCIARHVRIGAYCILGNVKIFKQVSIASRVSIPSGRHQHRIDRENAGSTGSSEKSYQRISIGEKSWIGEGAIVMADVGERCVVGAGSVVTKSIEDGSVVAGNPARNIRNK